MTPQEALHICKLATTCAFAEVTPEEPRSFRLHSELIKQLAQKHELETMMNCIKKQIPAKPCYKIESGFDEREIAHCPSCGNYYGLTLANYCSVCGQRMLWGGEE